MKYLVGALLIFCGISWFVLAAFAVGMASRGTTRGENTIPFIGVGLIVIGVVIMW